MRKIYITLMLTAGVGVVSAQRNGNLPALNTNAPYVKMGQQKALDDTLFMFDGNSFFLADPADQTDFDYDNIDLDGFTPAASSSWTSDWLFFFSEDPVDFLPGDVDTAFYIGSPSWFTPPGKADDWFIVGPITIPAGGADLSWYERHNPAYTDGYKVYAATSGRAPYVDVVPGTTTPLYTKATIISPTPQPGSDTLWTQNEVSLDNFANSRVYIFFHHDANDADLLQLDHMVVTENANQSVNENTGIAGVNVYPNPANNQVTFSINLNSTATTVIEIADITGKTVERLNLGSINAGISLYRHSLSTLESGVYFYTVRSGEHTRTGKLVVTH